MIANTLQQAEIPGTQITVTVVEEVLGLYPRRCVYSAYAFGKGFDGKDVRQAFSRVDREATARNAANNFWIKWSRLRDERNR